MSHVYEVALQHATSGIVAQHINTVLTAAGARAEIREIGIFDVSGVAGEVGLGRPAAVGTGGSSVGTLGQALDSADAVSVTTLVSAFVTLQPTAPTNFMRRAQLPGVAGAGIVWVWGQGELIVPVSANLCIWQISTANVTWDVYVKYVE